MIRDLPRLSVLAVIFIAATFGSVFSQTPIMSSEGPFGPVVKLIHEGKKEEALNRLKRLVKEDKLNAEAHYYLGVAYLQNNDFKKATKAFQTAMTLQPALSASAHAQFGYALVLRNNLKVASAEAHKALDADPANPDALYTMALLNIREHSRDEALKNVDILIGLRPDLAEAYLLKSMALVGLNGSVPLVQESQQERFQRYQAAADALDRYLKLCTEPQTMQLWQNQLESLKFHVAAEQPGSTEAYFPRQLTTKIRVLEKPEPSYTELARGEAVEGTVILRIVVGTDGSAEHVLVLQSLTHGLTEASIAAAKKIKFTPGILDGRPVPVFMQLEYNFNLY